MKKQLIGCIALLAFCQATAAAPFCAVFSYGKQCYYYSLAQCQAAAGSQGACVINDDEVKAPSGGGRFCVVSSFATQCYYYDADSCRRAAAASGGACVVNTN